MFKKDLYSLTNRELEEKYKINNFMRDTLPNKINNNKVVL